MFLPLVELIPRGRRTFCNKRHRLHHKILDVKYQPTNLKELTANIPQLTVNQQQQLYYCLNNCAALFDGTLGLWKGDLHKIELRDGAQPHYARPYRVPQA